MDLLKEWLNDLLEKDQIAYEIIKTNKGNEGKWLPLIPPYDYLNMENDVRVDLEHAGLENGNFFNEHGIGFDQFGNELKHTKEADFNIKIHDEL